MEKNPTRANKYSYNPVMLLCRFLGINSFDCKSVICQYLSDAVLSADSTRCCDTIADCSALSHVMNLQLWTFHLLWDILPSEWIWSSSDFSHLSLRNYSCRSAWSHVSFKMVLIGNGQSSSRSRCFQDPTAATDGDHLGHSTDHPRGKCRYITVHWTQSLVLPLSCRRLNKWLELNQRHKSSFHTELT